MRQLILIAAILGSCLTGSVASAASPPVPTATPAATPTALPGWPGDASHYLGRYRIARSSNKKLAAHGQLTVFMRTFKPGVPAVMSGILALYGKHRSNVFYLTQFSHTDTRLQAVVNLGSYAGPVIGKFVVVHLKGKHLRAKFAVRGVHAMHLTFFHFSAKPQP